MRGARINADQVFNALGDPTRRAIVQRLAHGPSSVSALAAPLDITLTAVRQHLNVLEACGLVSTEKVGRVRTCRFETKGLDVLEGWIGLHRKHWTQALDRLGEMLDDDA
jgi:DNA-binding transcriptional ArsR family regulator